MASPKKQTRPPPPQGLRRSPRGHDKALPKLEESTKKETEKKSPKSGEGKKILQQTSKRARDEDVDELAKDTPAKRPKVPEKKTGTSPKRAAVKTPATAIVKSTTNTTSKAPANVRPKVAPQAAGKRRKSDKDVALETHKVLPEILASIPHMDFEVCKKFTLKRLQPLTEAGCPKRKSCKIRVVNEDTIDAALRLNYNKEHNAGHVVVLNMANAAKAGSGWLSGALAQEECLFWRTTLSASLKQKHYPIKPDEALYSPDVAVIRESRGDGHRRYDPGDGHYPLVAVMSVAAQHRPAITKTKVNGKIEEVFSKKTERDRAKYNARICLRLAARRGHRNLVLGALGCGVFSNPRHDMAKCWKEVFGEDEFQGGWWDSVEFAVLDRPNGVNLTVYTEILDGLEV